MLFECTTLCASFVQLFELSLFSLHHSVLAKMYMQYARSYEEEESAQYICMHALDLHDISVSRTTRARLI